jgi:ribosomal protein L40E
MLLTVKQAYELLAKHRVFAHEICDKCGAVLGAVRFTRRGDAGVWCSRECRDGKGAHAPGTCKACGARLPEGKRRGTAYCDTACKQAAHRSKPILQAPRPAKLSVTKPSIYADFSSGEQAVGISGHPGASSHVSEQM